MFEIIPNWHPMFVHFSIALLSMSTVFFVALKIMSNHPIQEQLRVLAYWNLWLGTGFAIATAIAGWFAYNSVAHDTPSHEAMTEHRNWALVTLAVFILMSIWSVKQYKNIKNVSITFTFIMVMGFVLLASAGWRGSEAVYRYGLGVMSMPKVDGDGHAHEHSNSSIKALINEKGILNAHDSIEHAHPNQEINSLDINNVKNDSHDSHKH